MYEIKSFKMIQSFSSRYIIEKLSVQDRLLITKIIIMQVKLSLMTTIKRKNRGPAWAKPVPGL